MKFNFLGCKLSLNRKSFELDALGFDLSLKRKDSNSLKMSHVNFLNDQSINYILSKPKDYFLKKVNDLKVDHKAPNSVDEALKKLDQDGIFIIPNFISESASDALCTEIEEVVDSYKNKLESNDSFEDEAALIHRGLNKKRFKKYNDLASYPRSILDIRSGKDSGMIDIFNIDYLLNSELNNKTIEEVRSNSFLNSFLSSMPKSLKMKNINSYVNSGITSTRGLHVDSYNNQIKIFIYLTDVLELKQGPYTYVKGTHKDNPYRHLNKHLSDAFSVKTETPIVDYKDIYPILAKKGSLVISDQSGFHRGFPQSEDGFRRTLTINCK